jgi:hypothetical protein
MSHVSEVDNMAQLNGLKPHLAKGFAIVVMLEEDAGGHEESRFAAVPKKREGEMDKGL